MSRTAPHLRADPTPRSDRPLIERVQRHLERLWPEFSTDQTQALAGRVVAAVGADPQSQPARDTTLPGADEIVLITYAGSVVDDGEAPLQALRSWVAEYLADTISTVHVLPFFESSSDGGFSVVDYRRVDSAVGDWPDIERLGQDRRLMFDIVCNHGSAQSSRFAEFIADREPGRDWFVTADPSNDLSDVVRPRTHPLLTPVETVAGVRHVWTTFSADQVDFDFSNPDVLVEFCSILGFYLDRGASRLRLDAIAYLWKQIGTSCVHLPQTHEVVKLMRTLSEARSADTLLITETNVPHDRNVSYFGAGDEAHVVYNFTLAPLLVWSVLSGSGVELTKWLTQLDPPPPGCSFLNFIASHDGIGVRPVEDLLDAEQMATLLRAASESGGSWSDYTTPDGPLPYELNVSLVDLLAGIEDDQQARPHVDRLLIAHQIMLAVQGIPAIYLQTLLAAAGDHGHVSKTGHKRDINRPTVHRSVIDDRFGGDPASAAATIFTELRSLALIRRAHVAFSPSSTQQILDLDPRIVAIERVATTDGSGARRVLALHNVSDDSIEIELPEGAPTLALRTGARHGPVVRLNAFAGIWLSDAE